MDGNDRIVLLPDSQVMRSDFFAGALAVEEMPGLDFDLQIPCEDCESMGARGPGATQAILDGVASSEQGVFVGCLRDVTVDKWGRALSCLAPYRAWNAITRASLARLLPLALGRIYLVTNYGTAQIAGMSLEQAVKAMISIAPPDLRKILSRVAWKKLGIL
jgi:hypothetical protein